MSTHKMREIREYIKQATWTSLDWTTDITSSQLDVSGSTPRELRAIADGIDRGKIDSIDEYRAAGGPPYAVHGADWEHEWRPDDGTLGIVDHLPDDLREAAEYIEQVEDDAHKARAAARLALAAAKQGDFGDAQRYARAAAEIERQYGDAPTWGGLEAVVLACRTTDTDFSRPVR